MLFADIIGHSELKNKLIQQVKNNRVSHAQLFLGKEGAGNFALALAFAQYVNCVSKLETDSCGTCHNCTKYNSIQHPDLNFIFPTAIGGTVKEKPESSKFYSQWRDFLLQNTYFELDDWCKFIDIEKKQPIINKQDSLLINSCLSLKSYEAEYKVVIIWLPEKMNLDCANKILKTLEEPHEKSLLLMVAHQLENILPTIISRVQTSKLSELSDAEIAEGITNRKGLDDQLANSIAKLSNGSFSKALALSENPDRDEYFIEQFQKWMRFCYKLDVIPLHPWVEEMGRNGREEQKNFLEYCLRMFRECTVKNYGSESLVKLHHKEVGFVQNFSKFIHAGNIVDFNTEFSTAINSISRNGNAKIIFMALSLKVCNFLRYKA